MALAIVYANAQPNYLKITVNLATDPPSKLALNLFNQVKGIFQGSQNMDIEGGWYHFTDCTSYQVKLKAPKVSLTSAVNFLFTWRQRRKSFRLKSLAFLG